MNRNEMFETIKKTPEWDLIIIGGGATGLWCALDGASRGYKTLLVEKDDFAEGTSSRSTKLLHGGLRYLKQGRLGLIHEGLVERGYIAKNAPHLFTERAFLLPFYNQLDKPYYKLGMILYDFLAGKLILKKHRFLNREEVLKECPTLASKGLVGGAIYYDGQFDDARFAIELAKTAAFHGACLINYCKAESFQKKDEKITGITIKDLNTNSSFSVKGKSFVNATGVFTDETRKLDIKDAPPLMVLSRGSHITIDKKFYPLETALIVPKTKDKRVIFIIPWLDKILIGTTESAVHKPTNNPRPSTEEIEFLLEHAKKILSPSPSKNDILSAFAGIRPLVKSAHTSSSSKLSRNHEIIISESGLVTIVGGKWTTGRKMAEDTINKIFKKPFPCKTKHLPLHKSAETSSLDELVKTAVLEEMALTASDILARRTRTLFLDTKKALLLAPQVIKQMAIYLKKESYWEKEELKKFTEYAKSYWT